ncbi:methylglyoxal synthase [Leptospira perolatii]|uniref:Methylglyoxal synthase n=1 Tax=Leptospira perolatii TaxID=2023191 RepID=A0A2M9ZHZ7_9LEPT|nr:methylglyoxal synthase [Leptospira perolatii]PJZ68044.1 methylglyoxal synthase [Leptospira perolatii]PJZ71680.1 methylglyoxal synthase [Leptospira perolatii]
MRESEVPNKKRIVLIAHDNRKSDLVAWVSSHLDLLSKHSLLATGTTGKIIHEKTKVPIECFVSGPLGGDLQIGAQIVDGEIDMVIFFWDPLTAQPHDPDVKALLRIAVLYNIPIACNRVSADYFIQSPLINKSYRRSKVNYATGSTEY